MSELSVTASKKAHMFKEQVKEFEPSYWAKRIKSEYEKPWQRAWAASMVWNAYPESRDCSMLLEIVNSCTLNLEKRTPQEGVELLARIGLKGHVPQFAKNQAKRKNIKGPIAGEYKRRWGQ